MAHKTKPALHRTAKTRAEVRSPRRAELEPRGRCVSSDTHAVELKARSSEDIGEHLQRSSRKVEWNTDEPDVD
jgi:hypothetical protein